MYMYVYIPLIHCNHTATQHIIIVDDGNSSSSALAHHDTKNAYIYINIYVYVSIYTIHTPQPR